MKRNILLIILSAVILSCSNVESIDVTTLKQAINFNAINDKILSRAANASSDNYQVLAKDTSSTGWFINEVVDGTTDQIVSGKMYYWFTPPVDINFWAYAPAVNSAITVNNTFPDSSITLTIPTSADLDFTIANEVIKNSGLVAFQFKHTLSKLSFTVSLAEALLDAGYTITTQPTVTLYVDKNIGTISPITSTSTWTSTNKEAVSYSGTNTYMIMPQSAISDSIALQNIAISKGGSVIYSGDLNTYIIKSGDIPALSDNSLSADSFMMNSHYLIAFEINSSSTDNDDNPIFGDAMSFDTTLVDWDDVDTPLIDPSLE